MNNTDNEIKGDKYNVENRYQHYLRLVKLDEVTMHPEQKKQLRQTWYGAFASFIIMMDTTVLSNMEVDEQADKIQYVEDQVQAFLESI